MASAWTTTPGSRIDRVDARLTAALEKAAKSFAQRNPGYRVEGFSGQRPRATTKNHPAGRAIDVNIYDPNGNKLGNVKNAATFGIYESLAHEFRAAMDEAGLQDIGRWGGYFQQGVAFDQMHFDVGPRDAMAYGTWENGLNEAGKKALPGAKSLGFKSFMDALFGGFNPKQNPGLPETMQAPRSLADVRAMEAIADYGVSRALNAQPPSLSPPNPGSIRGLNVPSALSRPSAPPSNFSIPDRPSPIGSAPVGQVSRAALGPALNRPSPPSNFAGGTTPAAAPSMRQAAGTPTAGYAPKAQAAGTPTAGYNPKAQAAGTPTAGYNVSMPSGISRPAAPSKAAIEGALSQAQGKIAADEKAYADFEAARAQALSSLPGPPTTVNHPPNPTVGIPAPVAAPPALAAPPAQVLAPALVQRPAVNDYPVASIPAAPKAKAYDVYSGMAETAMDNTGTNTIGRLQDGTTTVTNKYGVTTGMTPYGKQTAIGSLPGISGPVGQAVKGAMPAIGGSVAGGLLGGPLGALLGGLIAKEVAKPGGLFSGQKSFNTDWFGNIVTNKAVGGLGFPDRPSSPAGARNVRGFDSASDRSHAYGISPGAAAAIDRGGGGLY